MPGFTPLKPVKPSLAAPSTELLAASVPALQPALCLHIALSCYGIQACRLPGFKLWPSAFAAPGLQPALCLHIPRGSFHQAPGRQRSSIAACPLPAHSPLLLGHSSLPFARLQTRKTPKTLQFPRGSFHNALWPSAFAAPGLQPALCLYIPRGSFHPRGQAPGRQHSSIAARPLPAHSPLLLGHSSLPFARLQTLKTCKTLQFPRGSFHQALWPPAFAAPGLQPALCLHIPRGNQAPGRQHSSLAACPLPAHSPLLLGHSSLPFARLQTLKTRKTLQFPRGSFHNALWPSAFAAPGLQPALCLHIPRGSFHQAPGRQHSSIAARPLPAHSPLLLGHSSLPFARLQTPKTLQFPRGSFHQALWPPAFAAPGLQPALCLHIPRGNQASGRQHSSLAACPLPAHSPLLLGHSSLPFARLQTLKTRKTLQFPRGSFHNALWRSAFAAPGLQPALCLHIPRGSFHQAPGRQHSSIAACPLPAHSPLLLGQCFAAEVLPLPSVPTASAVFLFHFLFSLPFCRERANVSSGIVFPRA